MDGWVGGWMDGHKSCFNDCLQQSKIKIKKDGKIINLQVKEEFVL